MPLVAHSNLPAFERLASEGQEILSADRAQHQDIRELHAGLLNLMPDAALLATERCPEHYFPPPAMRILDAHGKAVLEALESGYAPPEVPEKEVLAHLDNTWTDTGKAIFNNWLGLVYQVTDPDRKRPFMPGIDPDDPLGVAS